jgi:hypothetical protein
MPLIKISMEVFREWKSSKLGIEAGPGIGDEFPKLAKNDLTPEPHKGSH